MSYLEDILKSTGDTTPIIKQKSVSGGDINEAFYVRTTAQEYFAKRNKGASSRFFQTEARGLELLRQTGAIDVPRVYHHGGNDEEAWLVLEYIPAGTPSPLSESRLGERLSRMHARENSAYGFDQPTFIGELLQENHIYPSWLEYYRSERLLPQIKLAGEKGKLPPDREKRAHQLLEHLDTWIPEDPGSSLLHGDLWGSNWMTGPEDTPYLIDPSVLYGDRLMDLAFTELFGGYSRDFYEAYAAYTPLPDYYQDVKPLYQLFYLFVHLNMFGEAFGSQVDRILTHYTKTKG